MNNMQIVIVCLLIMALTMKKTIGFTVLSFFSFALNGKSFNKEGILLSIIACVLIVLQISLLYIVMTHLPFYLEYK